MLASSLPVFISMHSIIIKKKLHVSIIALAIPYFFLDFVSILLLHFTLWSISFHLTKVTTSNRDLRESNGAQYMTSLQWIAMSFLIYRSWSCFSPILYCYLYLFLAFCLTLQHLHPFYIMWPSFDLLCIIWLPFDLLNVMWPPFDLFRGK